MARIVEACGHLLGALFVVAVPSPTLLVRVLVGFAARNVALASAVAITLLNRIEYAVFGIVYFLTEVRLLLGMVVIYRCRRTPAVPQADLSRMEQENHDEGD